MSFSLNFILNKYLFIAPKKDFQLVLRLRYYWFSTIILLFFYYFYIFFVDIEVSILLFSTITIYLDLK